MRENTRTTDNVIITLRDENGDIKQQFTSHNLVVDSGLSHIADQLSSTPDESAMSHIAIGSGTASVSASDTSLGSEEHRNSLTTQSHSADVVTYEASFAAGEGTAAITEYGIFNAASGGVMLARVVDSVVNKGSNDTLDVTWTVDFNAS